MFGYISRILKRKFFFSSLWEIFQRKTQRFSHLFVTHNLRKLNLQYKKFYYTKYKIIWNWCIVMLMCSYGVRESLLKVLLRLLPFNKSWHLIYFNLQKQVLKIAIYNNFLFTCVIIIFSQKYWNEGLSKKYEMYTKSFEEYNFWNIKELIFGLFYKRKSKTKYL